jgi:hypothetical protein
MAEPVPTNEQGPNEQSIVASGMTVEQWKRLHPGEELGPAPEDIDQVTTDPPEGGPPPPEASLEMAAYFNPAVKVEGHPAQVEAQQKLTDAAAAQESEEQSGGAQGSSPGSAPAMSDQSGSGTGNPNQPAATPDHASLTTHAQLDKYTAKNGIDTPAEWDTLTVAGKKDWLDYNG